jgi:hypothetical protein
LLSQTGVCFLISVYLVSKSRYCLLKLRFAFSFQYIQQAKADIAFSNCGFFSQTGVCFLISVYLVSKSRYCLLKLRFAFSFQYIQQTKTDIAFSLLSLRLSATDTLTPVALSRETRPTHWLLKSAKPPTQVSSSA